MGRDWPVKPAIHELARFAITSTFYDTETPAYFLDQNTRIANIPFLVVALLW
jgi:hypothetical protein